MPTYVDAYLLPMPKKNLPAYRKMAAAAAKIWKRHGALRYVEAALDDAGGEFCPSFTKPIKLKPQEILVLAFVTYKSRAHRDRVNKKVMSDPDLTANCNPDNMPFDPKRMAFSGFSAIVDA